MSDQPENTPENSAALEGAIGEITHGPSAFEQFLDKNQKKLVIGGVTLIVGLVGYVVADGMGKKAEREAAAAVSAANNIAEHRAAADAHSGTNAAGAALYRISQLQWEDDRKEEAVTTMEKFIADYASHPLFINAKASLGSYNLQLGAVSKAKTFFEDVVSYGPGHELYGQGLLSLGDIALREGDDEKAKELYERIGKEFEGKIAAGLKNMALSRLELVGVQPPAAKPKEEPKKPSKAVTPAAPVNPAVPVEPTAPVPPVVPTDAELKEKAANSVDPTTEVESTDAPETPENPDQENSGE